MTMQEIKDGNRLISKFMGGEYKEDLDFTFTKSGWFNTPANHNKSVAQDYDLNYHSSWNWIIPVFQKCIAKIEKHSKNFDINEEDEANRLYFMKLNNSIEEVWIRVVEFIKFYNKFRNNI